MSKRETINPPINPGISLLIVVFLTLCLFTFSAITLSSAINEFNRSKALSESTKDYYDAQNKAQDFLAATASSCKALGLTSIEAPMEESFAIGRDQVLEVRLVPCTDGKNYFTVEKWKVQSTATWEADDTLNLFMP